MSQTPPDHPRFFDAKRWVQLIAVVLAAIASWMILFVPIYSGWSSWEKSNGTSGEEYLEMTLPEANGWPLALMVAAIPLALTLIPALIRGSARQVVTVACTVLLAGIAILTGFSVGPLYVLPLVAAVCACPLPPTRHDPRQAIAAILAGAGLVSVLLSWNNRLGPGEVCWGSAESQSRGCHEYLDPLPFLTVGIVALLLAIGLEIWARRRPARR